MYSLIKLLREKGKPRALQAIANDEGFPGELRFTALGNVPTVILYDPDDEFMHPIVTPLEHARLIVMQVDMMKFHGVERDKDGVGYEQEWSVKILGYDAPPLRY